MGEDMAVLYLGASQSTYQRFLVDTEAIALPSKEGPLEDTQELTSSGYAEAYKAVTSGE